MRRRAPSLSGRPRLVLRRSRRLCVPRSGGPRPGSRRRQLSAWTTGWPRWSSKSACSRPSRARLACSPRYSRRSASTARSLPRLPDGSARSASGWRSVLCRGKSRGWWSAKPSGSSPAGLALGIPAALAAALAARSLLAGVLFELSPTDPLVLLSSTAVILLIASIAAYLPARRAARIDPVASLKYE